MKYAKFKIPVNEDGSVVSYSPGWCGTRERCALNEKGLLYHDKERWGIMQFEGDYIPDDVEVLDEKAAVALLAEAKDEEQVYFGEKLARRYDPEAIIEDKPVVDGLPEDMPVVTNKAVFCPVCHVFIMWLPENIIAKSINLVCKNGHKVVLNG